MYTPTVVAAVLVSVLGQQQPNNSHSVVGDDYTATDGSRGRWACVEYTLPTGENAEFSLAVTDAGASFTGEGWLAVAGEVVAEVTLAADGTVHSTWRSGQFDDTTAAALDGLTPEIAEDLFVTLVPVDQRFACSDFGKKAVRAGKYIMMGVIAATSAACCGASAGTACSVCLVAGAVGQGVTADLFNDYCE